MKKKLTRREFLQQGTIALAGLGAVGFNSTGFVNSRGNPFPTPYLSNPKISRKVIVLGFDGMEPSLVERFVAEGELPTFKRLMETGHFGRLQTTMPAQSPVAWSSFITGTNPGAHGIFDFIHRDPKTFVPYLSTAQTHGSERALTIGDWSIPYKSESVVSARGGLPLWKVLEKHDIFSSFYRLPGDFPVSVGSWNSICGMGTPDLLGGYGTCHYFTESLLKDGEKLTGARVVRVQPIDNVYKATIEGPPNAFRVDKAPTKIEIVFNRDPKEKAIKIRVQDQDIILQEGEWSDWTPLRFDFMPVVGSASGIVRFYCKQVHPRLVVYMSPINIDPMEPALPICSPEGYSRELAKAVGRFHTLGLPADTKSLSAGLLDDDEYLSQAKTVLEENLKAFDYQFARFKEGCFFFYFGSTDQNSHMLWRAMDPKHPLYDPKASPDVKDAVKFFYRAMDKVLQQALSKVDSSTTLLVLSDHGFGPFTKELHLNSWLIEKGYMTLANSKNRAGGKFFSGVDWERTTAYGVGFNGLYVNLAGRERYGSVPTAKREEIRARLLKDLAELKDPETGQLVTRGYSSAQIYSGDYLESAPDILVGYQPGYRVSDESVLGQLPEGLISPRTDKWSADHCIDSQHVPGVFLSNKHCTNDTPRIWDLAPSILNAFGLEVPKEMTGKPVLEA